MQQLCWKLVVPLTIISFTIFSKWWYVLPVDAPDTMMLGFPVPYVSDGWHTSMSLQIFIVELVIDLLFYFVFWFVLVNRVNRHFIKIVIHNSVTIALVSMATVCVVCLTFVASMPENIFYVKRHFDVEILETGYKFMWEGNTRPENFDFDAYEYKKLEKK